MFTTLKTEVILAAGSGAEQAKNFFEANAFGKVLATLMGIAGILLIIIGIVRAIGKVAAGQVGAAVKGVLITAVFAVFLLQPGLVGTLVDGVSNAVKTAISGFSDATKTS